MKTTLLAILLCFAMGNLFAQDKAAKEQTFIDLYLKPYSSEAKYQVNTMGEAMVKRSNEMGMWTHPSIARIMKQVKLFKTLNFNTDRTQEIIKQIAATTQKAHVYNEYFKWEMNGAVSSVIYTRNNGSKVVELVYLTANKRGVNVSCFIGDDIDLESIRSLAQNK